MNRADRRLSNQNGRRLQKREWNEFADITLRSMSLETTKGVPGRWDRIFQNNRYIVFVNLHVMKSFKFYIKVMCRRSDSEPIYSWNDLYRIKNEIFGEEVEAIQFMPKVSELVDQANLYWFFIEESPEQVKTILKSKYFNAGIDFVNEGADEQP